MSNPLLNISASGLRMTGINLQVTGNNITNASTPDYSYQEAVQTENTPLYAGVGCLGQGANVTTVRCIYNQFLTAQMQDGQASTSATDQPNSLVSGLSKYMPDSNGGLTPSLASFPNAADGLAPKSSDTTARQVFLNTAAGLQSHFNSIAGQLGSLNSQVNMQMQTRINAINGTVQQIAASNDQISKAEASTGQPVGDLCDQRDQLVRTLSQSIEASVIQTGNGQFNIYVGNGQTLVQGNQSCQLTVVSSQYDPTQLSVDYKSPGGTINIDDSQLGSGALGGLMDLRNNTLIPAQNSLGRLATAVSADVNAQNKLGMDANGKMGTDFFSVANLSAVPSTNNTGSGSLTASIINTNTGQGYDYQVKYQGGAYTVSYYSNGFVLVTAPSWPTTTDSVTLDLSGTTNSGDSSLVRPTVNAAVITQTLTTDYHSAAAASPMVLNQGSNNTGSAMVSSLGVDSTYVDSPFTPPINLTYSSAVGGSLSGFPGSVTVMAGGTSATYAGGTAPYTQGVTCAFNGAQMTLSGSSGNGDTFAISANTVNSTDNRNASALAKLRNSNLLDGGTTSIGSVWNNLVTQAGVQVDRASTSLTSQKALLASFTQQQQSVSGVSLDEEAMNLMKHQQAYQTSAKVMQTANSLFGSLLSATDG